MNIETDKKIIGVLFDVMDEMLNLFLAARKESFSEYQYQEKKYLLIIKAVSKLKEIMAPE